jgi:hypothetical protein
MFVAGITGWYIPIASFPNTSGVVVTTKSIYAKANSLRLALLRHLACTEQLV